MENLNKYIVYVTVNLCNGKLYFGVHRTNPNVFDGYIGCGILGKGDVKGKYALHKAVKKYGYENFKRTTISIFPDTPQGKEKAYELEKQIVTETLLKSKNVYNMITGGKAGADIDNLKRVYMYDLKGNYLRSFKCIREAALWIGNDDVYNTIKAIRNNCLGTSNSSFNYYFSYKKEFNYIKNKKKRMIALYTLSGKFLRTWDSIAEAETTLQICTILLACAKKYLAGGYQWRYYEGNNSDIEKFISSKIKNNSIPINMYDKSGNFIESFNSINECIKKYSELSASQINRVIKKIIKSHKGFTFKYKDEDIV